MWRQKYPDISVFRKIKRLIEENRSGGHWKPLFFPENRRIPHEIRLRAQKKTRSSVIGDGSERLSVFYLLCHICGRMNLLTSSMRTPKVVREQRCDTLMPFHKHSPADCLLVCIVTIVCASARTLSTLIFILDSFSLLSSSLYTFRATKQMHI